MTGLPDMGEVVTMPHSDSDSALSILFSLVLWIYSTQLLGVMMGLILYALYALYQRVIRYIPHRVYLR